MRPVLFFLIAALVAAPVQAETTATNANDRPAVPEPPPPPENYNPQPAPEIPGSEQAEPEVTITTKGTEIHEEYRLNGRLYMIKVIPAKGKPYYLIDHEGSGQFRRSDFDTRLSIPTWVIKRF